MKPPLGVPRPDPRPHRSPPLRHAPAHGGLPRAAARARRVVHVTNRSACKELRMSSDPKPHQPRRHGRRSRRHRPRRRRRAPAEPRWRQRPTSRRRRRQRPQRRCRSTPRTTRSTSTARSWPPAACPCELHNNGNEAAPGDDPPPARRCLDRPVPVRGAERRRSRRLAHRQLGRRERRRPRLVRDRLRRLRAGQVRARLLHPER